HALLSTADGEPLGSFGDAAVFSLPKSLPTPDGGVAVLRAGWSDGARRHSPPRATWLTAHTVSLLLATLQMRHLPVAAEVRAVALRMGKAAYSATGAAYVPMGTPDFDLTEADTTMSALSRRILMRQDFATIVARRRRNYRYLLERLDDVAPPIVGALPEEGCPLFYPFRVARRDAVLARIQAQSVPLGEFWPERHPMTPDGEFPGVNELAATALWLPCHPPVTERA